MQRMIIRALGVGLLTYIFVHYMAGQWGWLTGLAVAMIVLP